MTPGYSDDLMAEARRPCGDGKLASPHRSARAENPVCGDEIELDIADDGRCVTDLAHRTRGCVFTKASASLLARAVVGLELDRARDLSESLRHDLGGSTSLPPALAALSAVRVYPARIRCALLPWDALRSALARMA